MLRTSTFLRRQRDAGDASRPPTSRAVGVLAAVAMVAASCGDDGGGDPGDNPSDPAPDSLTIATSFPVDDLVPLENGQWAPELGYGDLLMKPLPGGEVEPWVLESLDPVDDTTWELELRDGVTFHNGNPLDGEVLAELMNWHLEHNSRLPVLLEGAAAEATGPLTVELTTPEPVPSVPSILANEGTFVLLDLATYEDLEDDPGELVDAGIYTGPYTVTSLTPDAMEMAPAEAYYGDEPDLAEVTILFVPDEQSRVQTVQSGEADVALYPPTSAARQLEADDSGHYLVQPEGEATVGMLLFVNQASPALEDADVRKAIQLAIDYEALAAEVMNGLYDRSPGLYPSILPYSSDLLETDPAQAEELLDDAGWERDGDETRTQDGDELQLRLLTYPQQPDIGTLGVALEGQLAEVGIDLELVEVDDNYEAMEDPDGWELGISNEHAADLTGGDPLRPLLNHYRSDGVWNFGGIDDGDLDGLIDELSVTSEEDARIELLGDIQRVVVEEQAYGWFLAFKRTPVVAGPAAESYPLPIANLWLTPYT